MITRSDIVRRLKAAALEAYPEREASAIAFIAAEYLTGCPKIHLITDPSAPTEVDTDRLDSIAGQISSARPIQYITGHTEFCGLDFTVGEGVLIPRPETEELVRWIVSQTPPRSSILDLGTGSGAIAVALASAIDGAKVTAVDLSAEALRFARANADANRCDIRFVEADMLSPWRWADKDEQFDVTVSNPPYVPVSDRQTMHPNVTRYEPAEALFVPDDDPCLFYKAIAKEAARAMRSGGALYFEIYEESADAICRMLDSQGWSGIELRCDMNDKPRMIRCLKR